MSNTLRARRSSSARLVRVDAFRCTQYNLEATPLRYVETPSVYANLHTSYGQTFVAENRRTAVHTKRKWSRSIENRRGHRAACPWSMASELHSCVYS